MRIPIDYSLRFLGLFAVYFATARLSLAIDNVAGITPVWLPSSVGLVALFILGYALWPAIALGALLANVSLGTPALVACGVAAGSTLEAIFAAYVLHRVAFRPSFDRVRDVVAFVALVAGLSTMIGTTIGVTCGWLGGAIGTDSIRGTWVKSWLGGLTGDLIVGPFLFVWCTRPHFQPTSQLMVEGLVLLFAQVLLVFFVFDVVPSVGATYYVILLFPVLVWSAMRLEQHGAVTSLFLIAAISLWRTVDGRGSFQAETLGGRLMVMQLFLATAAITSLILGAGISEMKEAERKLREAERMAAISQMESGLAHQSRNALQRSQACLEMLSRNIQDRPAAVSLVTRIQDAQDQLHRLYDQVRSYSAPIQLQRESVCVEAIVHDAWIGLVGQRNGRNARLTYDPANASLFLQADSTRMGQVIREIIMNSIEACADPVEVVAAWCHTTLNGRPAFRISLRDNGPGMSDEQRRRVFEPFYTTKPRGLGLGMAIAQRIVDAHGGRISVSDFGPGAEIVITLPRGNV